MLAAKMAVNVLRVPDSNSPVNVLPAGMDASVRMKLMSAIRRLVKMVAYVLTNWPVMCVPVLWAIRGQIAKKRFLSVPIIPVRIMHSA